MCKKKQFSKAEAKIAVAMAIHSGKKYRREKRIYYCGSCNAWHLTSKE